MAPNALPAPDAIGPQRQRAGTHGLAGSALHSTGLGPYTDTRVLDGKGSWRILGKCFSQPVCIRGIHVDNEANAGDTVGDTKGNGVGRQDG